VEFYEGANLLATVTQAPYSFNWNATPGSYTLFAKATDNLGAATTSTAVNVTVTANSVPTATINATPTNATAPATIYLTAAAGDTDGTVAKVEFFNGATLLATATTAPYSYSWTNVPIGSYQVTAKATDNLGAATTSDPVVVTITNGIAQVYYIDTDHLNTPRLITNSAGQVVWKWDNNDPFGNNAADENPSGLGAFKFNQRFPGQYYDVETGLHYNYYRDYDPATGGYNQSDPLGLRAGINTYTYVGGNPVNDVDPYGLMGGNGGAAKSPAVSVFGCVGVCASYGTHDTDTQVSMELTLGGGIEICDPPPPPPPPTFMCSKNDGQGQLQPPGLPLPKKFGGLFIGPSIKADGRLCVRLGPHASVPFTPSIDLPSSPIIK
jgi:RHS repeat-associated protein